MGSWVEPGFTGETHADFVVEGLEREKFLINGETIDAVVAGRLASDT
ncbi:hypothetical protein [Actinomyces trachealis]|nr:hypothetical protein [Actinomyces trachealis]